MANEDVAPALHLEGGNYYDDVRIDISESHARMDALKCSKQNIQRSALTNRVSYLVDGFLQKYRWLEFLAATGLRRQWFIDFHGYWSSVLTGRPLYLMDFPALLHDYRKKQQHTWELSWNSPATHVQNWQDPALLYNTLWMARKVGFLPIVGYQLWPLLKNNMRILEYGCGAAPYYYCYRRYYSHLSSEWLLADIPNFTLHYAKYLYRHDSNVEFVTIQPSDFADPLKQRRDFDVIVLTTVLEHLDEPVVIADYLLQRLKPGGIFVFDYIKSQGLGLDTPNSLAKRRECLGLIMERVELIRGKVNIEESVGLCIARKKS